MVDLVHQLTGKHIVYVLQCEPLDGKETRYVGTSTSIEKNINPLNYVYLFVNRYGT